MATVNVHSGQVPAPPREGLLVCVQAGANSNSHVLAGLAPLVMDGRRLYCVDGVNRFDPYAFSQFARGEGVNPEPLLDDIFVTRAFTIHQIEAVAAEMLPRLAELSPAPLVAVLGIDHLFLEETLTGRERGLVLSRVLGHLGALRARGMEILVTYEKPPKAEAWWRPLLELGDLQIRAVEIPGSKIDFQIMRHNHGTNDSNFQHVASGGNRLLEAFSAHASGGAQGCL